MFQILLTRVSGERLCDVFDVFSGTSTGALLALGLATQREARDLRALYSTEILQRLMPTHSGVSKLRPVIGRPIFDGSGTAKFVH